MQQASMSENKLVTNSRLECVCGNYDAYFVVGGEEELHSNKKSWKMKYVVEYASLLKKVTAVVWYNIQEQ